VAVAHPSQPPLERVGFGPRTGFAAIARAVIGLGGLLGLAGCASLMSRSTYSVSIASEPSAAAVTVENLRTGDTQSGVTPCRFALSASAGYMRPAWYRMTFEKPGYYTEVKPLYATLDGWYCGNLVFSVVSCSWVGLLVVDPATGAMWALDETVDVTLVPDTDTADDGMKTP
jgi:hypothetical protein